MVSGPQPCASRSGDLEYAQPLYAQKLKKTYIYFENIYQLKENNNDQKNIKMPQIFRIHLFKEPCTLQG